MKEHIAHSGAWGIALIVIVVASWFLYRYLAPKTWREWASAGVIQAFIIALYAEMYGVSAHHLPARPVLRHRSD
jgi:hypothetical protein